MFFCLQYSKHLFVHISQSSPSYNDPYLEAVDIRQIYDKFPEKKGGLKELFERGPSNAFFLVKFWVSAGPLLPSLSALRWWGKVGKKGHQAAEEVRTRGGQEHTPERPLLVGAECQNLAVRT